MLFLRTFFKYKERVISLFVDFNINIRENYTFKVQFFKICIIFAEYIVILIEDKIKKQIYMDGKDPCPCINLNRVHRFNLNIKIMKKIFKINSDNRVGLVQEFKVVWNNAKSGLSLDLPIL